jgi:hypothetical protein
VYVLFSTATCLAVFNTFNTITQKLTTCNYSTSMIFTFTLQVLAKLFRAGEAHNPECTPLAILCGEVSTVDCHLHMTHHDPLGKPMKTNPNGKATIPMRFHYLQGPLEVTFHAIEARDVT